MSDEAKELILKQLKSLRLVEDIFQFDFNEFCKHLSYKTLEIDNGAILTAPLHNFNECFQEQQIENSEKRIFKTIGKVINEKLKKSK